MGNRPEKKQNRKSAGKRTHYINTFCCGHWIVSKQKNKNTPKQNKKWCSGRMRNLYFKTAAYKFTTIPKAAARFSGHYKNCTGKQSHYPSCNNVGFLKVHTGFWFIKVRKP